MAAFFLLIQLKEVRVLFGEFTEERDGPEHCDCVIYLVDASRPMRNDFASTLKSLAPHQTLSIAVIVDEERDESSEMDSLARFIQSLGGLDGSPLATVRTNWRLWCIKSHGGKFPNWFNLLNWGFYDVMCKRIGSG